MRYAEFEDLYTARLCLRKLRREDIPAYYERIGSSPDVTRYMLFPPHRDIREAEATVENVLKRYETGKCYRYCIALKESDELIGVIEPLRFDEAQSSCSFAYMLGKDYWGRGFGTEALSAVLAFLFEKMEMLRVEADHMAENPASGAVMRKAGMQCQGRIADKYEKDGKHHDAILYAITRDQWKHA